jgi:threonine dehydrogenase-like Zn-dependent dehydrogenase
MPKEFIVIAPKTIAFRDYEEPPLKRHEVRIRTIVSGIKHGTELALYSGQTPFLDKAFDPDLRLFVPQKKHHFFPLNLGSWASGEVVEVGEKVTRFKVGDRVHGGLPHRPTNVAHEAKVFPLPDSMTPETALFTDPALFALQAVHDAQIKVGDRVAVVGLGAIGLLAVQIARLNGAERIFAVDLIDDRLQLAKQCGADEILNGRTCDPALEIKKLTGNKGVDVALEISGAYAGLQTAIRCVHVAGLVVAASYFTGSKEQLNLGAEWHHNRPTLRSSMAVWGMPHRNYPMWNLDRITETAVRLLEDNRLVTDIIVGKRFPYENAVEAYRFIDQYPEKTVKTLFDYPRG